MSDVVEELESEQSVSIAETAEQTAPDNGAVSAEARAEKSEGEAGDVELKAVSLEKLPALLEALIFVSGSPIELKRLASCSSYDEDTVKLAIEKLRESLIDRDSGIELAEISGGFQFRTRAEFSDNIRALKMGRPRKLSPASLETLAIIAYRQPIVRSDIEAIRGVDTTPTLKTLLDRKLVRIVGHQSSIGQPALFGTTDRFLEVFGLSSISGLPTLKELKELSEEPGEISDEDFDQDEVVNEENAAV